MEKYTVTVIDVPHDAATGITVGRFAGIFTTKLLADSVALGAGEVAQTLTKVHHIEGLPFYRYEQAVAYVLKERKVALYIEDTCLMRPHDLEKLTHHSPTRYWPINTEWTKAYSAECHLCHYTLYPGEKMIDSPNGYKAHAQCPELDEDGRFINECIQTVTGFVLTHSGTIRGVIYKDNKGVEHGVAITQAPICAHMNSQSAEYLNKAAAFRCQAVSADGEMYDPEFLGIIYEEATK